MARGFFSYDPKLTRIITTRKGHRNEILFSLVGKNPPQNLTPRLLGPPPVLLQLPDP